MHQEHETTLIRRIQKGERELFRHLVQENMDAVFGLVFRQVGDKQIAEDIAQEVFVRAFRSIKKFQFRSKFSTWLTRIAINTTHSYFSSKRHRQSLRTDSIDSVQYSGTSEGADHDLEQREVVECFQSSLAQLKPAFREVLVLCGLEGKKYEEVAELLEIPVGTVRSRLNAARNELKRLMRDRLGSDDVG